MLVRQLEAKGVEVGSSLYYNHARCDARDLMVGVVQTQVK
jgi:hypothetical protein